MLFVFDWDGTLRDSTDKIITCMQQAAKACNVSVPNDDEVKNMIGLGLEEAIAQLYPNQPFDARDTIKQSYADYFVNKDTTPVDFFPGVMGVLCTLKEQGHLLTIATGKSRKGLNRVLDQLDLADFFHASRCADETTSKPHPHMLHELLAQFSVSSRDAVMIGDTEYDMDMAQRIGMPRIAVSYGAHHIDRLKPYHPVLCADRFEQVYEWALAPASQLI